jgi:16S rRNA (uracil1498-N3)-methyltransferase
MADEVSGRVAALTGAHAEHLARVLRARVGQEFDVAAGDEVRRGRVISVAADRVELELGEVVPVAEATAIVLALAVFKFDRMEWAIEKCTELGVAQIVPVIARRTESHLATAAEKRVERWKRIAREAAEQSRRAAAPEISTPIKIKEAVGLAAEGRILLSEGERAVTLGDALAGLPAGRIALAVGPEGGWTENEIGLFQDGRWTAATLGHTILRAETAAIAAVAVVVSEVG